METNKKCEDRAAAVGYDTLNCANGGSNCASAVGKVIQPTKRRTSFSKRISLFSEETEYKAMSEENDAHQSQRTQAATDALEVYMGRLRREMEAWRAMREERKQRYKQMDKLSKQGPLKLDWESCRDLLTEEDRRFLDDQPDYDRIVAKMREVEEMASIVTHLEQTNVHRATRIVETARLQSNAVKRHICKLADLQCVEGTLRSDEHYPPVS